jgi:hypothetical protein
MPHSGPPGLVTNPKPSPPIPAGQRAVIGGTFAMIAARQTRGQLNMQLPGLNIYAEQSCTENARICRG